MAFQEATSLHDRQVGVDLNVDANGNVTQIRYWNFTPRAVVVTLTLNSDKAKTFSRTITADTQTNVINIPPGLGSNNKWEDVGFGMYDI